VNPFTETPPDLFDPTATAEGLAETPDQQALGAGEAAGTTAVAAAKAVGNLFTIPWYVYAGAGLIVLVVVLHELNPTIGLLTTVRKG
jgi:hypothetical protein